MRRKAVICGVDFYAGDGVNNLKGCTNDAIGLEDRLRNNLSDNSANFETRCLTATNAEQQVSRRSLDGAIDDLFGGKGDVALFYFSGHGFRGTDGAYLLTSDAEEPREGVSVTSLYKRAADSKVENRIIILDCCDSGGVGDSLLRDGLSELPEGMTILTATRATEAAVEQDGQGVFTSLLFEALEGTAANILGEITPSSVYALIDQSLGNFGQRPLFKTNVEHFISLRTVTPPISRTDLKTIAKLFPERGYSHALDPSYEPKRTGADIEEDWPQPDPANTAKFRVLQTMNRLALVVPENAEHMYDAAVEAKSCRLTGLGEHYRRLVELNRI